MSVGEAWGDQSPRAIVVRVLADLVAQSRGYPGIDWAVGVYVDSADQVTVYGTSNEGFGYLPWGLRWPVDVVPVFSTTPSQRGEVLWQGLRNPGRIIADHFERIRYESDGDARLAAIGSSMPLGRAVSELLERYGAPSVIVDTGTADAAGGARHRLEIASPELFEFTQAIQQNECWSIGVSLLADAARACGLAAGYPAMSHAVRGLRDGDASVVKLDEVGHVAQALADQAHSERVQDSQLGPVQGDMSWEVLEEHDVYPSENGQAYVIPFQRARVCSMLERVVSSRRGAGDLSLDDVLELAYEHYSVVEDEGRTRTVLAGLG